MKSKIERNYYRILLPDDRKPDRLGRKKTDAVLKKLSSSLQNVADIMDDLYNNNYPLYRLVCSEAFSDACIEFDDGKNWKLDWLISGLHKLQDTLSTHDDDIRPDPEYVTMYDLGFKNEYRDGTFWEKVIEESDEKSVVEEVQTQVSPPLRRLRTTIWEKTDYGKSSKSITYKKLSLTKEIRKAAENTARILQNEGN